MRQFQLVLYSNDHFLFQCEWVLLLKKNLKIAIYNKKIQLKHICKFSDHENTFPKFNTWSSYPNPLTTGYIWNGSICSNYLKNEWLVEKDIKHLYNLIISDNLSSTTRDPKTMNKTHMPNPSQTLSYIINMLQVPNIQIMHYLAREPRTDWGFCSV